MSAQKARSFAVALFLSIFTGLMAWSCTVTGHTGLVDRAIVLLISVLPASYLYKGLRDE